MKQSPFRAVTPNLDDKDPSGASAIVDPLSAESYRLYRRDQGRVAFRPFRHVVQMLASVMMSAHPPQSNLAQAFTDELKREILRIHGLYAS